ncbi:hypothetical protein L596_021657 [Steinernema carpocapsae]|uniref:Uncharacterized protein n=1 Tax=Steinernema carpocapsae TaxID=34508 RepID=A0A4U5MJG0_STECR|nr:hypothetical protein L596_021657 [Steinernema carpocapsae]
MQKDCGNFCPAESAENDMQTGGTNTSSEASFAEFHFRRQTGGGGGREGGRRERKINYDLPIYKSVIGRVLCGEISYTEAAEQIGKLAGRPVLKQSVYRYCQKVKLRNPKTWNEQTAMDRWIAAPTPDCGVYLSQWALLQAGGSLTFVSEEEIPGLRRDLARRLQNFHRQ